MIKGDIFTSPIEFALQEAIKRFEGDKENELLYGALKRSEAMWEKIRIHGLQICGLTYDQFCEQLEYKKNVIFLSDDEVETFNKAVQIMEVMSK
jgi:hypothetical protein